MPITLVYGAILLIWLMSEERGVASAAMLGLGMALLIALHRAPARAPLPPPIWQAGLGALIGAGGALLAAGLMFLKTAVHAHPIPDYPLTLMLATSARAPAWALGGALLGLAHWLWRWKGR